MPSHSYAPTPATNTGVPTLFVIVNAGAGGDIADLPQKLTEHLEQVGYRVVLQELPASANVAEYCDDLVRQAAQTNGVIVAAGGDGTVNAVAALCYTHKVVFSVIPLGTFNYFARALGIPMQWEDAAAALAHTNVTAVSAGFVGEHLFLNNASFGLYPTIIRQREKATARFGRKRIIGALSALHSLFTRQETLVIKISHEGHEQVHRTSMVFVGNNSLQLENLGLEISACTQQNRLAVMVLKPSSRFEIARLLWRGIVKNLDIESKLHQFCADSFVVEARQAHMPMVIDGEVISCSTPIHFRVEAQAMRVLVPLLKDNV